jgi:hypothetical protein
LSLLEEAQKHKRTKQGLVFNTEEIELAQAWIDNQVGTGQVARALKYKSQSQTHSFIAHVCQFCKVKLNK